MEEKIKRQNIQRIDMEDDSMKLLQKNEIKTIDQLTTKSKHDLQCLGIQDSEIERIENQLQILGGYLND